MKHLRDFRPVQGVISGLGAGALSLPLLAAAAMASPNVSADGLGLGFIPMPSGFGAICRIPRRRRPVSTI
jgi:hypothetical protein